MKPNALVICGLLIWDFAYSRSRNMNQNSQFAVNSFSETLYRLYPYYQKIIKVPSTEYFFYFISLSWLASTRTAWPKGQSLSNTPYIMQITRATLICCFCEKQRQNCNIKFLKSFLRGLGIFKRHKKSVNRPFWINFSFRATKLLKLL